MSSRVLDAAMHAFPRRFRASRGVEMRDTLDDVLDADPRRFAVVRAVVDIVLAGWALRMRTRPTLSRYLRFRLFERPLAPADHPWLFDYVQGWFRYRHPAVVACVIVGVPVVMNTFVFQRSFEVSPDGVLGLVIAVLTVVIRANVRSWVTRDRDHLLRRHGYVPVEHPGT